MKSAEDIKRYFQKSTLSANLDRHEAIFETIQRAQEQSRTTEPTFNRFSYRSTIMKNPLTKLAFAAILIIASLIGVFVFNQTSGVAWAIEQSIAAAGQYKAILIEGFDTERTWKKDGSLEQRPYKSWAVANENQTMIEKYRHEMDGVPIIITNGQKTWRYDPNANTVHIENRPYVASECWFGNKFLEQLKGFRESGVITSWEVTYGQDSATGKQQAFLKIAWLDERYNGPRSLLIEFDMESKLPIGFKQWENPDWEGQATLVGEKIMYYENLPDELFEFEIPEGATVIEY